MTQRRVFVADVPCVCYTGAEGCYCGDDERVLRAYVCGLYAEPMTPEQREHLISEADWAGEGEYPRAEAEKLSDKDLAKWTLDAWWAYVQSNCLP